MKNHHSVLLKSAINISEDAKVTLMPLLLCTKTRQIFGHQRVLLFLIHQIRLMTQLKRPFSKPKNRAIKRQESKVAARKGSVYRQERVSACCDGV